MGKQWKQWETLFSWALFSLGSKTTVDGDCSHEIKKIPWKKSYDKSRQCMRKQRLHFANKCPYSQSYGFSSSHVWMWELDHKKAEHWRIDAAELWCWRRLLRVPWTARRSNQSILKEINPEYSLEGLMLKLKLQYFGHLMQRADSLEKDPDAWKDWRQEEKGMTEDKMIGWHNWLNGLESDQAHWDGEGQGTLESCSPWGCKESDMTEGTKNKKSWHIYRIRWHLKSL